jgi:transcriptional regulator with XRE-family HTH domain
MVTKKTKTPIGKRLMAVRKAKKLTLKQVANETGLAPDYISRVEKGEVMPPVAVILQLSRAMEVDSSVLLSEEKKKERETSARDYEKRTEAYSYQVLTPQARNKHLQAFRIHIDPLSEHRGVSYQHPGEEFAYVLKGKVEIMVGESKNVLEPHQSLHFNSSIVHKMRNLSPEQAELLVILYTP